MRVLALSLTVALLAGPVVAEEWRLIGDDWTKRTIGAVLVDGVIRSPDQALVTIAMWTREMGTERYAIGKMSLDCAARLVTFERLDMLSANGDIEFSIDGSEEGMQPQASMDAASQQVSAMACDGVPMTTTEFASAHEFFEWVVAEHGLAQRPSSE